MNSVTTAELHRHGSSHAGVSHCGPSTGGRWKRAPRTPFCSSLETLRARFKRVCRMSHRREAKTPCAATTHHPPHHNTATTVKKQPQCGVNLCLCKPGTIPGGYPENTDPLRGGVLTVVMILPLPPRAHAHRTPCRWNHTSVCSSCRRTHSIRSLPMSCRFVHLRAPRGWRTKTILYNIYVRFATVSRTGFEGREVMLAHSCAHGRARRGLVFVVEPNAARVPLRTRPLLCAPRTKW